MARIRTIKPEFFRSRSLARCSRDARLTFQGLWVEADDAGRGIADTRILKGAVWPLDDDITPVEIQGHLQELVDNHIRLYEVGDERYYVILNWEKHQAAAYRKAPPKYPPPPEPCLHESARPDVHGAHVDVLEGNKEGNIEGNEDEKLPGREPSSSWDAIEQTAHQLARITLQRRNGPVDDDNAFIAGIRKNIISERADEINGWLDMALDPLSAALRMAGPAKVTKQLVIDTASAHPPECDCDGTGWVQVDPENESRASYATPCTTVWPDATIHPLKRAVS